MTISGNCLYVADQDSGLYILDISNPFQLTQIGSYIMPGSTSDLAVSGNLAYLSCTDYVTGFGYLRIIDVSDPAHPVEIGYFEADDYAIMSVVTSGDYAYLELHDGFDSYLTVIDVSDPVHPMQVLEPFIMPIAGMCVVGNYLYVVGQNIRIYDISNPLQLSMIGSYNSANYLPLNINVVGDYAYIAWYSSGLCVLDVSNPATPTLAGSYNTSGWTYAATVVGDHVYMADGAYLGIYQFLAPGLNLALTPEGSLTIPPSGGSFQFNATMTNNTSSAITFQAWIKVQLPNQSWYGPVLGPLNPDATR
jgi:hypothetical protein